MIYQDCQTAGTYREGVSTNSISDLKRKTKTTINSLNRENPNIIIFIIYGILYETVINIYKPFAVKFLQRVGGNDFHIALYNSLPGLVAMLVLLPGVLLLSKLKTKRNATSMFFLASRFFFLLIAAIPFLPPELQPLAFVVLVALMNFPEALAQTSLQGFLGSVFDSRLRASAISLRNKFGSVVLMIIPLVTGMIITFVPKTDTQAILWYQIFFVIAFLIGLVEIFVFRKFKEREAFEPVSTNFKSVSIVLKDKKFTKFLSTAIAYQFAWQAGWPLCAIYHIRVLDASEIWFALFSTSGAFVAICTAGFWVKFIRKHGNNTAILLAIFTSALTTLLFPFTTSLWIMFFITAFSGFATFGSNTTLLNGLLQNTKDENRLIYIGTYNTFVNMSLFLSPLAASLLLTTYGIQHSLLIIFAFRSCAGIFMYLAYRNEHIDAKPN